MASNSSPFTQQKVGNRLAQDAHMLNISQSASTSTTIPSTISPANTETTTNSLPPLSMSAQPCDQLSFRGLSCVLRLCCQERGMQTLPVEIVAQVYYLNHRRPARQQQLTTTTDSSTATPVPEPAGPRGDPTKPPPQDIFTSIPVEIRMQIFASWLPAKHVVVKPPCGADPPPKDPKRKGTRNKTSDMMTVCKKIKDEMITCCYEERTFAIHVHEGLTTGGVEAFDAGSQPLHYQDSYVDDRFTRFGDKNEFGFKKLKKIEIEFFPTSEDARFTTINTYFMSRALAGLLERGGGKENRIVSITFKFAKGDHGKTTSDRRTIMARENRWWDSDDQQPRSTALGFISDIELVLRPFAILDNVHNVKVELPPGADSHADTARFVATLVARMTGSFSTGGCSAEFDLHDQAEQYVVGKRDKLEAEIYERKFGNKGKSIPHINEDDFEEPDDADPPDSTEVCVGRRSEVAYLVDSANEDDQQADLADFSDPVKPMQRSGWSSVERVRSQAAQREESHLSGTGRRLGPFLGTNATMRSRLIPKSPAMMQLRGQTGVDNAGPAAASGYAPSTVNSTLPPTLSRSHELSQMTGEIAAREREDLRGAGGSEAKAISHEYTDSQAQRASSEDTAMTDATSPMA